MSDERVEAIGRLVISAVNIIVGTIIARACGLSLGQTFGVLVIAQGVAMMRSGDTALAIGLKNQPPQAGKE